MEGVVFWSGTVAVLLGLFLSAAAVVTAIRRRRVTAAGGSSAGSTVTVDRARPGPVALRGHVARGPAGAIHEPLGGTEVVWYRLTASAARGADRGDYVEVHSELDARDFLVDDGSRTQARVVIDDAGVVVPRHVYGRTPIASGSDGAPWTTHELTEQQATALRTRCIRSPTRIVRADLQALAPGTPVTIVGWLEWERGDRVVVGRPPDHPLIVYGVSEAAVRRDLGRSPKRGRPAVLGVLGALLLGAGVAAAWWSRSTIGW